MMIGIPSFLVSEDTRKNPVLAQSKPYNFHWAHRAGLNVGCIAAGYGFTVIGGTTKEKPISLFGFGINTDSQLGLHSVKGTSCELLCQFLTI